jgi:hypothetical protein
MRVSVRTTAGETVNFDGDQIVTAVDGDGELYVTVHGEPAAIFARGRWDYARPDTNPATAPRA